MNSFSSHKILCHILKKFLYNNIYWFEYMLWGFIRILCFIITQNVYTTFLCKIGYANEIIDIIWFILYTLRWNCVSLLFKYNKYSGCLRWFCSYCGNSLCGTAFLYQCCLCTGLLYDAWVMEFGKVLDIL